MQLNNLLTPRFTPANVQQFVAYSFIALGQLLLPYYLQIYQPVGYIYFVSEDSWSEYMTFVLWSMTAAMLVGLLIRHPEFRKPGYFAFAGAAFVMAMEEISWGQRLLGLPTMDIFTDLNLQGEMNLHNLASDYQRHLPLAILVGVMVVPTTAWIFESVGNFCERWGIPLVPIRHWPLFAVPVFLHFEDLIFHRYDTGLTKSDLIGLTESGLYVGYDGELAELSLAVATAVFVTSLIFKIGSIRPSPTYKPIVATGATLIFAVSLAAPLVHYFPSPGSLQWGLNRAANRIYPIADMYPQAGALFEHMRRHPQFSEEYSKYYHSLVLSKLGQKKEAKEMLERLLIQQSSVPPSAHNSADHFRTLGKTLHALSRLTEACQAYGNAIALYTGDIAKGSDNPNSRWGLAKTFFAMGQWNVAAKQIELVVRADLSPNLRHQILRWHRLERDKAFQARLLPDITSPNHPGCMNELRSLGKIDHE